MMNLRMASGGGGRQFWRRRTRGGGGVAAVACASTMPLIVLGLAVAADYVNVARFTTRVQRAADAAAVAVSGTIARNPNVDERDVDELAERIGAFVFARKAPRGAGGAPTVATTSRASVVTTTIGYQGVAPSNFGSALGYGAISVTASATSLGLVADSRATSAPFGR
jgi:Flp pilus assembly protein TadG